MGKIILIGGGGHCKSIIDTIQSTNEYEIVGILDTKEKVGNYINNIKIISDDSILSDLLNNNVKNAFICAGSVSNNINRINIYNNLKKIGFHIPNIIDKSTILSRNIVMGHGNFVGKGCIINSNSKIGNNCIINTGCIIEHDCIINDFVHMAPGATLSGGICIGYNSHVGTNCTIIQNIRIGSNTMIGAGSVVVRNIGDNKKAYGNPCIQISNNNI